MILRTINYEDCITLFLGNICSGKTRELVSNASRSLDSGKNVIYLTSDTRPTVILDAIRRQTHLFGNVTVQQIPHTDSAEYLLKLIKTHEEESKVKLQEVYIDMLNSMTPRLSEIGVSLEELFRISKKLDVLIFASVQM